MSGRFLFAGLLALVLGGAAMASQALSSKLSLRLANGTIQTGNANVPSESFFGGFDGQLLFYPAERLALGVGYTLVLNGSNQTVAMSGASVGARYYWWNAGTFARVNADGGIIEERQNWLAAYAGLGLFLPSYNLQSVATPGTLTSVTGSSLAFNGALGAELRFGRHWELTLEAAAPLMAFALNSNSMTVSAMFFLAGLNYVW